MAICEYEGKWPEIAGNAFVPESPVIIGDAAVGVWAMVVEGSVVRAGVSGERNTALVPARVMREVSEAQKQEWFFYRELYTQLSASRYPRGMQRIG